MEFAELVAQVALDVQGCPTFTIEEALRAATVEFCDRTHAWVDELDGFVSGDEVSLDLPAQSRLVNIIRLVVDGVPVAGIPRDLMPGMTNGFTRVSDTELRLHGRTGETVTALAALAPTWDAESVPDEFAARYRQAMVVGAKMRLLMVPGLVWSNPQLAGANRALFNREINQARLRASQDDVMAVRFVRQFFI